MSSSTTTPPGSAPDEDPTVELTVDQTLDRTLATPAVGDDLNVAMRRAAQPFSTPTLVLVTLLVLAAVFAAGAWTHEAFGSSSPSTPARAGGQSGTQPTGRTGAGGYGQFGQGGYGQGGYGQGGGTRFAGGRGTTGTIERVDGGTITVKTAQGSEVTVSTSDSTTVAVSKPGKLTDLKPGATVVVQGQADQNGTVAAQAITQQAAR